MTEDPRLELVDVERLVAELPWGLALGLSAGALEGKRCRVCAVLKNVDHPAAKALFDWHEFFAETPQLDLLTKSWRDRATEKERHDHRRALGEWKGVAGSLSHARCAVIYLAAAAVIERTTRP